MKMSLLHICLLFVLVSVSGEKNLTVHVISHSHNDAGWLRTMDEYYRETTSRILDSVTAALIADGSKVFHWSDIAFFNMWWNHQNDQHKKKVTELVKNMQLIFVGGGWVMNDEALPSYKESMLQMRLGLDFLRDTFGIRPTIGWQIDPFGSSAVTVSVLYKLGFEVLVENRMSADFKRKLSSEDGYNFVWEGHQVTSNKTDASIFTHVLQRHYNIPGIWSESQFLSKSISSLKNGIWEEEIQPTIDAITHISGGNAENYHVMITGGDDFTYVNADRVYQHYSDLSQEIEKLGTQKHFNTTSSFTSLYEYFKGIHSMDLTYGKFTGDFLPYEETFETWEDFWTGYYSSRLHLKRFIRHAFNDIQSTKTLLAIRGRNANNGKVEFSDEMATSIDEINSHITEGEQEWGVLMHHDGITGTHTVHTEPSYYKTLSTALHHLEKARELMDKYLPYNLADSAVNKIMDAYNNFVDPEILFHTVVNTAGYFRIQIVNITVPGFRNDSYVVCDTTSGCSHIDAYFTDLTRLEEDGKVVTQNTLFFTLPMDALSYKTIAVVRSKDDNGTNCSNSVKCAQYIPRRLVTGKQTLQSRTIKADFSPNGEFERFEFFANSVVEEFTESFGYYKTDTNTRSGLYIFNPRHAKKEINFSNFNMTLYEIGDLVKILQVFKDGDRTQVLKTYIVNMSGCPNLMKQVFLELQIESKLMAEISFDIKKKHKSGNSHFKAYADDSMKLVERPIYDTKVDIKRSSSDELKGYFTYACVHGGMLRETYDSSKESFFGWANSNPIGCTFAGKGEVDIMVFRSIGKSDNKGVNDRFQDSHVMSTSFQFYIDKSVNGVMFHKVRANTKLNEPYGIFQQTMTPNDLKTKFTKGSTQNTRLLQGGSQLSGNFGEVDVVDIKLMRHKLIYEIDKYELALVLRNRFKGYVDISKTTFTQSEALFKNDFVDILKLNEHPEFHNKCDPDKKVLDDERYDLQVLETEYDTRVQKSDDFHGLEPFELAEFRVVHSSTLEAITIKKDELGANSSGARALSCNGKFVETIEEVPEDDNIEATGFGLFILVVITCIIVLLVIYCLIQLINKRKRQYRRQINVTF